VSDGSFSSPDPADTGPPAAEPPSAGGDGEAVEYVEDGVVASGDVDCRNCIHKHVCSLFAGIAPMLEDYQGDEEVQGDEPPIDPTDLAVICDELLPKAQPEDDGG